MDYSSLRIKKYKLFEEVFLPDLKRVNIIIGKNNSGKSSLIDAISAAYDEDEFAKLEKEIGELIASTTVSTEMVEAIFNRYSGLKRWNLAGYSNAVVGKEIGFRITGKTISFNGPKEVILKSDDTIINELRSHWPSGLRIVEETRNQICFRRMNAERDIVPEHTLEDGLSPTGEGATNLIRKILSESNYDESTIEIKLLNALNSIFQSDGEFESIRIQQINGESGGMWEVFLQEKGQQRIPLSKMGSGLKTIILILLNLLVIPGLSKKTRFVYAFEEIENNLHPALQRRVFDYLYKYAVDNETTIFITTHSHVAINCFYDRDEASLYHIEKKDNKATVYRIESYLDKAKILSDLDVKASDILQSNGIIWVEGPSDRVYIKRWIELLTDNEFEEGKDYQFLYYGGRLLSHYSAEEETDLISILTTNRNAAIVIDSDKIKRQTSLNNTKKRIIGEFSRLNMFSWVTKGKEIENYIPVSAIRNMFGKDRIKECGQYELFPGYIEKYYKGFSGRKVQFANSVIKNMLKEECEMKMDLQKQIKELYRNIEKWNR